MENRKSKIEESFIDFAHQNELYLNSLRNSTWYNSLSGAIKALKMLQLLIGGEIQKGQRVLTTYTTDYVVVNSETGSYRIMEKIRNEFIVSRIKAQLGVFDKR